MLLVARDGTFYRVFEAGWDDPLDTAYARRIGGRWNPAGEFGALYLNATMDVARANARYLYAGSFYQPEDLTGAAELKLLEVRLTLNRVVDCATAAGLKACNLTVTYPAGYENDYSASNAIAREAFRSGDDGVTSRSAAECTPGHFVGDELAVFDRSVPALAVVDTFAFLEWYPRPAAS